jgi:hypothetical protein
VAGGKDSRALGRVSLGKMPRILWLLLGLALLAPACSDPVAPPAPTPVTPTITETFTGTLGLLGTNTHLFSVQQVGGLTVTISDITPDATLTFGIGAQSLVGCTMLQQLTRAPGGTAQLSGTVTAPGNFCVMVFDSSNITEPVTYTLTVLHS